MQQSIFLYLLLSIHSTFRSTNIVSSNSAIAIKILTFLLHTYIFTGVSVFAGGPKFIGNLQNVTVSEGKDATFTCSLTNLGRHKAKVGKSAPLYSIGIRQAL